MAGAAFSAAILQNISEWHIISLIDEREKKRSSRHAQPNYMVDRLLSRRSLFVKFFVLDCLTGINLATNLCAVETVRKTGKESCEKTRHDIEKRTTRPAIEKRKPPNQPAIVLIGHGIRRMMFFAATTRDTTKYRCWKWGTKVIGEKSNVNCLHSVASSLCFPRKFKFVFRTLLMQPTTSIVVVRFEPLWIILYCELYWTKLSFLHTVNCYDSNHHLLPQNTPNRPQ